MKKGITVISLTIVILLLAIVTSMVVYTNSDVVKVANKVKYAMEILDIQTKVDNYYLENGEYPSVAEIFLNTTKFKEEEMLQVDGETITSDKIKLYTIDLKLLGIKNTLLGNNKESTDVYAVSETTGRVYYLKGFTYKGVRYYTLTDELYTGLGTSIISKDYKEVRKGDLIFRVNNLELTKEAVTVDVMIPKAATNVSVTTTYAIDVVLGEIEGEYLKYSINTYKTPAKYVITVKYTLNGNENTITYPVNNVDSMVPRISVDTTASTGYVTLTVTATDEDSGIAKVKWDKGTVTAEYFKKYGKTLEGNEIKVYESGTYTIYAVDEIGNETVTTKNITVN